MENLKVYLAEYSCDTGPLTVKSHEFKAKNLSDAKNQAQLFKRYNVAAINGGRIRTSVKLKK